MKNLENKSEKDLVEIIEVVKAELVKRALKEPECHSEYVVEMKLKQDAVQKELNIILDSETFLHDTLASLGKLSLNNCIALAEDHAIGNAERKAN